MVGVVFGKIEKGEASNTKYGSFGRLFCVVKLVVFSDVEPTAGKGITHTAKSELCC